MERLETISCEKAIITSPPGYASGMANPPPLGTDKWAFSSKPGKDLVDIFALVIGHEEDVHILKFALCFTPF